MGCYGVVNNVARSLIKSRVCDLQPACHDATKPPADRRRWARKWPAPAGTLRYPGQRLSASKRRLHQCKAPAYLVTKKFQNFRACRLDRLGRLAAEATGGSEGVLWRANGFGAFAICCPTRRPMVPAPGPKIYQLTLPPLLTGYACLGLIASAVLPQYLLPKRALTALAGSWPVPRQGGADAGWRSRALSRATVWTWAGSAACVTLYASFNDFTRA